MVEIDGSAGEGGGQILRSALSLSALTHTPFRIRDIRKQRRTPGLRPQHLAAVRAMKKITGARVKGDSAGSTDLVFEPGTIISGEYHFDIVTAGSVPLLLQTILPPLLFSPSRSRVTLRGGTHVPFSPCCDYISGSFLRMLSTFGITVRMEIRHYGFYPKGGGEVTIDVFPRKELSPRRFTERGETVSVSGVSGVANLPQSIAERQRHAAAAVLAAAGIQPDIALRTVSSPGPGTFVFLSLECTGGVAGFSALGERGKRAEAVGEEAARLLLAHLNTDGCLDPHLADQLVLYLALAGPGSALSTSTITGHLATNLNVLANFLPVRAEVDGMPGGPGTVTIMPKD